MATIVGVYYYMCLAVGLINFRYDPNTQNILLYHWPTIVYCFILNFIFLTIQPISLVFSYKESYYCEELGPLVIMQWFLIASHGLACSSTILQAWIKRKDFQIICYKYQRLLRHYMSEIKINENHETIRKTRNILLKKLIASVIKIVTLYLQLYFRENAVHCNEIDNRTYIGFSIYYGILNMMMGLMDINMILGLLLIDMCLKILSTTLITIESDVRLMRRAQQSTGYAMRQRSIHLKWRFKLSYDVNDISREVIKLRSLLTDHIEVYQVPMLFLLLAIFVNLISLMFKFLSYVYYVENIESYQLLFFISILVVNFSNVMILFNICESIKNSIRKIKFQVYRISVYAATADGGSTFYRDELEINLETFLLQLRHRELKMDICGLFEIQNRTGIAMISKIILNLIYLIQSVFPQV